MRSPGITARAVTTAIKRTASWSFGSWSRDSLIRDVDRDTCASTVGACILLGVLPMDPQEVLCRHQQHEGSNVSATSRFRLPICGPNNSRADAQGNDDPHRTVWVTDADLVRAESDSGGSQARACAGRAKVGGLSGPSLLQSVLSTGSWNADYFWYRMLLCLSLKLVIVNVVL